MMKIKGLLSLVLAFAVSISMFASGVAAEDEITVLLNGEKLEFDVSPQLINSRTLVPVRAVAESLKALVE